MLYNTALSLVLICLYFIQESEAFMLYNRALSLVLICLYFIRESEAFMLYNRALSLVLICLYFIQESEAFMLYNRALSLQRQGSNGKAEDAFRELLEHPFITEVNEYVVLSGLAKNMREI